MKIIKILLVTLLIIGMSGCEATEETTYELMTKTNLSCGFDTLCQLNAYVTSEEEFNEYYEYMIERFSYYNKLFDIYNDYDDLNNIKTINDNAGVAPVEVDSAIIEMLLLAKEINDLSNGAFDVTDGAVLKIWHEYREAGQVANDAGEYGDIPSQSELDAVSGLSGFDYIEIDEVNNTVYITDTAVSLDVGGIAKGFATEKIAQELEAMGLTYGAVNAGGNQRIINTKADGTGYNVGITDPRGSGNIVVLPDLINMSVVTSGDYQNYYIGPDDVRYAHIIDPATSWPAAYYYSVTVVTEDSGLADCLSTAFFVLDYESGLELVEVINEAYDTDLIVVWISEEPLDDTSILSPVTDVTEYITCTANYLEEIITE